MFLCWWVTVGCQTSGANIPSVYLQARYLVHHEAYLHFYFCSYFHLKTLYCIILTNGRITEQWFTTVLPILPIWVPWEQQPRESLLLLHLLQGREGAALRKRLPILAGFQINHVLHSSLIEIISTLLPFITCTLTWIEWTYKKVVMWKYYNIFLSYG